MRNHMAIDQYGTTYHNLGPHPRKALLERICWVRADAMPQLSTRQFAVLCFVVWIALYAPPRRPPVLRADPIYIYGPAPILDCRGMGRVYWINSVRVGTPVTIRCYLVKAEPRKELSK